MFGRSGAPRDAQRVFSLMNVASQEAALQKLAEITVEDTVSERVRRAAIAIVKDCGARADECELESIFNAVKYGTEKVRGLKKGLKYMADPLYADFYTGPARLLAECAEGPCAEDCDGHAMLCAALAGTLGFQVGLRAWGPAGSRSYQHVYAVAMLPKEDDGSSERVVFGLDTSADAGESHPGWEPPHGRIVTCWLPLQEEE